MINEFSKLLINEPPLQVLPSLACLIGLHRAIVLQQIHYLLSQKRGGVMIDGEKYIYNSAREWVEDYFTFWKKKNKSGKVTGEAVSKHLQWLEAEKYLIVRQPNKSTGDMTKFYRIDYAHLDRKFEEFLISEKGPEAAADSTDHLENNPDGSGEKSESHLENLPDGSEQKSANHLENNPDVNKRFKTSKTEDLHTQEEADVRAADFKQELEEWYCPKFGLKTFPDDGVVEKQIAWFITNGFTVQDIKDCYVWATTDAHEKSWRDGPVTISAMMKPSGITKWKAEKQTASPAVPVEVTYCDACRDNSGFVSVIVSGITRQKRCKHESELQAAA